jgi:hypothetical protein
MKRTLPLLLWTLVLLPHIYVLSIGPVVWASGNGYVPLAELAIYKPLKSAYINSREVQLLLDSYLELWKNR